MKRAFETIALAKVATSAEEARALGFLAKEDSISMNADRLIADAKKQVLALAAAVTFSRSNAKIFWLWVRRARDFETRRAFDEACWLYFGSRRLDRREARADSDRWRFESSDARLRAVLLDFEREAFLSLVGMRKTQERIGHMLKTGKPLEIKPG